MTATVPAPHAPERRAPSTWTSAGWGLVGSASLAAFLAALPKLDSARWDVSNAAIAWAVAFVLLIGVVLPPQAWARRQPTGLRIWPGVLYRLLLTPIGIYLPLLTFLFAPFAVTPTWKGGAKLGGFSLIPAGCWFWLPAVLWACVALYVGTSIGRAQGRAWVSLGLLSGTIAAGLLSAVLGVQLMKGALPGVSGDSRLWCLVPFGTTLLYGLACRAAWRRSTVGRLPLAGTLTLGLGQLTGNVLWAKQAFEKLPETSPSCHVVTAATRGHAALVRPLGLARRGSGWMKVNRQLLVLWQFERLWSARAPRSHQLGRRLYDGIGPAIATRISGPWQADVVYLAIKPIELVAAGILALAGPLED